MPKLTDKLKLIGWTALALGSLYASFKALQEIPDIEHVKKEEIEQVKTLQEKKISQVTNYDFIHPLTPFYGDPISIAIGKEE